MAAGSVTSASVVFFGTSCCADFVAVTAATATTVGEVVVVVVATLDDGGDAAAFLDFWTVADAVLFRLLDGTEELLPRFSPELVVDCFADGVTSVEGGFVGVTGGAEVEAALAGATCFVSSGAVDLDLTFLLLGFGLNKRVSSLVVTTLSVGTGSEIGGGKFDDGGGVWLRWDELLIVGDGVVERLGAGGVHKTGVGLAAASGTATGWDADTDRDLFLDLFFFPRPLLLVLASLQFAETTGDGTGWEATWLVVPIASLPTALKLTNDTI